MAFTYSDALATNRDKLRFLLRDTVEANAAFMDAELDGMLTLYADSIPAARLALLLVLLADGSRFLKWTQAQNSVDKSGSLAALRLLIDEVKAEISIIDTTTGGDVIDFASREIDYFGVRVDPDNGL